MSVPPKPITRSAVWVALMTNLFVMPGLGTWMMGHQLKALVQASMSFVGLILMLGWLCVFAFQWIQRQQIPQALDRSAWFAVAGAILFLGSWFWTLMHGIALLRQLPPDALPAGEASGKTPPKL